MDTRVIVVSAVVLRDADGRWIAVRKRATSRFMHPGGKPEPGESARDAAVREVAEELGLELDPAALDELGLVVTAAANEPGFALHARVFAGDCPGIPEPLAEIEEVRWVDPETLAGLDEDDCAPWAPLLVRVAQSSSATGNRPERAASAKSAKSDSTTSP